MVDDALIDKDELSFEQYALVPKAEHIIVDSVYAEQRKQAFRQKLAEEPSVVILTHDDADGLTSAALVEYALASEIKTSKEYREYNSAVETVMYEGPFTLLDALEVINDADHTPAEIYILDFNFGDNDDVLNLLRGGINVGEYIWCYDHHQWANPNEVSDIDDVMLVVDEDECTATIVLDELLTVGAPQRLETLAQVTKDYDLWIREDPRSGWLQTFSGLAEPREYIDTVLEHGADLPPEVEERIDEQERENERLVDLGVERAEVHEIGDYDVAITYLGKGPSAEIGNELVEEEGHDIAVVQKAHGGGGIYSHSNEEEFTRCHEVAAELGGGGHPTASGFGHDFEDFTDLAAYWAMAGWHKQYDVIDAVREVVTEEEAAVAAGGDSDE